MKDVEIVAVKEEKDLGVTFDQQLKFSIKIPNCVVKANIILGLINRTFDFMDKDMFLTLYKALVRPHMEYASSVWNPWLKKDIKCLERESREGPQNWFKV
jgi:ribonuclease P/MRP protein subunit RPP40